ncbi:uncharacterized protein LOC116129245 [Pistacia vera]|uniref:uncharacterized protein LOC116129245 n=1 Tax=Pistacia vera TaxID=55513 RepID=UPI0012631A41|nr:uncharacterized protein LOC116129245 [Pistacia vera]
MLKKNPPEWSEKQTNAVKSLKRASFHTQPLKIPSSGKHIFQTDASDTHWGAVLFEQNEDKVQHLCGYQNGQFKPHQQHYHSTFKEVLAVKNVIERFEFHLVGHHFFIETDIKSFDQMLRFHKKKVPH